MLLLIKTLLLEHHIIAAGPVRFMDVRLRKLFSGDADFWFLVLEVVAPILCLLFVQLESNLSVDAIHNGLNPA